MVSCQLCRERTVADEMLQHLELEHGISPDEMVILEERREIRHKGTQTLLATWKEIHE